MTRVPQQGPQQAMTEQDWFRLDRIEQTMTTLGFITTDDAKWLVEHLTKLARAAAVSSSSVADPWQSIETAPKDDFVIGTWPAVDGVLEVGEIISEHGNWVCCAVGGIVEPTHWMPLPNPPSASSASAEADDQKKNTTI